MNKSRVIFLINQLIEEIHKNLNDENRIYIDCWVIGELKNLLNKLEGRSYYPERATTKDLFFGFVPMYFCDRIDPAVKMQVIYALFSYHKRHLICELYKALFTKEQRKQFALNVGYDPTIERDNTIFEIIRRNGKYLY